MTGSNVDDAQAAVAETDILVDVDSIVVRAAMRNHIAHRFQHGSVNTTARPAGKRDSINSAHMVSVLPLREQSFSQRIRRVRLTLQPSVRRTRACARPVKAVPLELDCRPQISAKCTRNLKSEKACAPLQRLLRSTGHGNV